MKKIGSIFLIIFGLLGGGVWYMMHPQYYYVKITENGTKDTGMILNDGKKVYTYNYSLKGYDKHGNEKKLTFSTHPDLNRSFKRNTYLKIIYTNLKQETGYEEVKSSDIPKKALNKLE
ncbi:YxeA family protein [Enterococcus faecalis]|uniref:YxeA family protein n=1 Tax=Enterococcus faecalis TaxID=1351 RepID=UPI001E6022B7|nr:YxeA family protein [Enterococcus faecalis]MCD5032963.1 YxeA family protein [Enterococcus faecalis]